MKRILCFGDSNTWGFIPASDNERYSRKVRWPGILAHHLGDGFEVVEMGQCGRTTVWDDPVEGEKNGYAQLLPTMECCRPMDLLILMLGTNDCKDRFSLNGENIARSIGRLVQKAKSTEFGPEKKAPSVLVVCPPAIRSCYQDDPASRGAFGKDPVKRSQELPAYLKATLLTMDCHYLDAGEIVEASQADGVHLTPEAHSKLGDAIFDKVKNIFELDIKG